LYIEHDRYAIPQLSQLAGYTSRVYSLLETLHRIDVSHYRPHPVAGPPLEIQSRPSTSSTSSTSFSSLSETHYTLESIKGKVFKDSEDLVLMEGVPIVAPVPLKAINVTEVNDESKERGGEVLIKGLDFKIKSGEHLLITGANGR
jgi:ATP-binding cassette, subfamily D (ALD), peroxisomal long-chain fatty acid import protein